MSGIKHFLLFPPGDPPSSPRTVTLSKRPEVTSECFLSSILPTVNARSLAFLASFHNLLQGNTTQALLSKVIRDQRVEVILRPGEMLYIPPFWIHEVFLIPSPYSPDSTGHHCRAQCLCERVDRHQRLILSSSGLTSSSFSMISSLVPHQIFSLSIPGLTDIFESSPPPLSPLLPIKLDQTSFKILPNRLVLGTALVVELLRQSVPIDDRLFIIKGLQLALLTFTLSSDLLSRYSTLIDNQLLPAFKSLSIPEVNLSSSRRHIPLAFCQ